MASNKLKIDSQLVGTLYVIVGVFLAACTAARPTPTPVVQSPPTETPVVLEDVVVERVEVRILESFPVQVHVAVYGLLPDACSLIENVEQERTGDTFRVTLQVARRADARCAPNPTPFEHTVPLNVMGLQAGVYTVDVHGVRETFQLAVDNVPLDAGLISGRVWHDLCAIAGGEGGAPVVPSEGCILEEGAYRANGLLEPGEPGIQGVQVTLGQGACPSEGLATAMTDAAGVYLFTDLALGTYCVTVNPLHEPNASILLPGGWTVPEGGLGSVTVTLGPGTQRTDVNLGWDYQFLPPAEMGNGGSADEGSAAFAAWLKETLAARDYGRLQTLMADPFTIAGWRSEGQSYPPAQAVEQLQTNYLGSNTYLTYPERNVSLLLDGADPFALFGPQASIVRILFADGWGPEGRDEALLYVSRTPEGEYRWYGVLVALGGFDLTSGLLAWHREGGIAGFCDDLVIYEAGDAHATSCAADEPRELGVGILAGERLDRLQAWVSRYERLNVEHVDAPLAADGMLTRLDLYGAGQAQAGEAEIQEILDFAAQVFGELGMVQGADVRYVMAQADLEIQSGPHPDYEAVGQLFGGQTALVTGKSLDGGWWRVICPDDRVASCWVPADPESTQPASPPPGASLEGGLLATFEVRDERFDVWVTNPQTIEQILDLEAGESRANIPNGRILRGPGPGGYNLPWNWHLDPQDVEMAEMTTEVCDGWPSYVNEHLDEFVDVIGRFCPWNARLVEVRDLRAAAEVCPEPAEGAELLANEAHGYCLLYPSGYSVEQPNPGETVLVVGSLLNVSEPRLYIEVGDAGGRTVEQAADAVVADLTGFEIARSSVALGGQDAVVLDGVPGQDISRQIIAVHDGRLYRLTFVPASEDAGEVYQRMETLYTTVLDSFTFSP